MRYEWQSKQWQQIWQAKENNRLPHSLLLSGVEGIGKNDFALHLAQTLLCQNVGTASDPCGECHSCRLVLTEAHPNIKKIVPEKVGHAIKIDQIREIGEFVQQSSFQGEYRFAIINPAHSMNMNSANALLKTLEEPAKGAVIILISDRSGHLPATIRSRCHKVSFPTPEHQLAVTWLEKQALEPGLSIEQRLRLFNGAPLLAAAIHDEDVLAFRSELYRSLVDISARNDTPIKLASKWLKIDPLKWLDLFFSWVNDLVRLQIGANGGQLVNQDYASELASVANVTTLNNNLRIANMLIQVRKQLSNGINFNKQLLFESILIKWLEKKPCN